MDLQPCLNLKADQIRSREKLSLLRVAIIGVGQTLRSDDGAGVWVARALQPMESKVAWLKVIDAGPAPEAFSGPLRHFAPHLVIFIDAAEIGREPGAVACYDWTEIADLGSSTHTLSLTYLAQYLTSQIRCEIVLAAIQPASLAFNEEMSPPVLAGMERLAADLRDWITGLPSSL